MKHILSAAALLLATQTHAATIEPDVGNPCTVRITGTITVGDFDALAALKDQIITHNGESTANSVACLDSPGGSLNEGVKIAEFILENGLGTRIEKGARCHSICAIMFMMGNASGAEVSYINRTLSTGGDLAFHSPSVRIKDQASQYSAAALEKAYDLALASVLKLIDLASAREPWGDGQMIPPDLVRRLLATPASDLFHITTFEQVHRWDIDLADLPKKMPRPAFAYQMACENALALEVELTSQTFKGGYLSEAIFDFKPFSYYRPEWFSNNALRLSEIPISLLSHREGYAAVGCDLSYQHDSFRICGLDETTGVYLGRCSGENRPDWRDWTYALHPVSQFRAYAQTTQNPDAIQNAQCTVRNASGQTVDSEPCVQMIELVKGNPRPIVRHLLVWPSGSKTVVDVYASAYQEEDKFTINGKRATPSTFDGNCLLNTSSGNHLCVTAAQP